MNRIIFSIILLVLFSNYSKVFSQDNEKRTGTISGRVVNSQNKSPVVGASVQIIGTTLGAYTQSDGKYVIKNVPPGIYNLRFKSVIYDELIRTDVEVATGRPVSINVEMKERVVELQAAEVTAKYFNIDDSEIASTQKFNFEDVRRAPGVQEDVVKATGLLPGVNIVGQRNDLLVRGGAPFENLYIIDNIEVQNINHFGSQGSTGGPLSIINIDNIKGVEFSAGGFGAKFGDKLSSYTAIQLRNGNEEAFGGKLNLSATGFGLNLEGPISNNGSYIFSARRSYLDLLFTAFGFSFIPQYWDFQGKVNYRLNERNSISMIGILVLDDVKLNNNDEEQRFSNSTIAVPNQQQLYTGITWQRIYDKGFGNVTFATATVNFETFQQDSNLVNIFNNISSETELILRADYDFQLDKTFNLTFGNQTKYGANLDYDVLLPGQLRTDNFGVQQPLQVDTVFNTIKNSSYATLAMKLGQHNISVGLRGDYYSFTDGNFFLAPRILYNYKATSTLSFLLNVGRYYQSPSYLWLIGSPDQNLKPIMADQIIAGAVYYPQDDLKLQVEAYYKDYSNYPARVWRPQAVLAPSGFEDASRDIQFGLEPLNNMGIGRSYGIEFFAQKKLSEIPCYGLVSLSISKTEFTSIDEVLRPGTYDTRAILNIAGGYRLSSDWEIGSKFRLISGVPTTPFLPTGIIDFQNFNLGDRLPIFHALDFRVDKKWFFDNWAMVTYIDIQNIYGRQNVSGIVFNPRTQQTENNASLGIFPTIGLSLEF